MDDVRFGKFARLWRGRAEPDREVNREATIGGGLQSGGGGAARTPPMYDGRCTMYDLEIRARCAGRTGSAYAHCPEGGGG